MNKFNRALAGVMVIITVFLMGAGPYHSFEAGILLTHRGVTTNVHTEAETVQELFDELGWIVHRFDRVTPSLDTAIHRGMSIELERAFPVFIQVDGNEPVQFYARPGASAITVVADFSRENRTAEDYQFYISPEDARSRPEAYDVIQLQTLRWERITEYETLDFERVYVESFRVPEGQEFVYRTGQTGLARSIYQSEYIGTEYIGTEFILSDIYVHPLTEIVHVGVALPEGMGISACGELFAYSRLMLMESTAYTLSFSCTGRHPDHPLFGVTASGMMAGRGIVAVDTNVIPFHTRLYIEGYGFAVAGDRGGAIRGYKIDVFMDTMAEARQWGRQHNVRVWILE